MKISILLNGILLFNIANHGFGMQAANTAEESGSSHNVVEDCSFDSSVLAKTYDYTVSENQKYVETPHPPLIVLFSACAGMGKTSVAKLLQEKLGLLRFNGDDTRIFLKKNNNYQVSLPVDIKVSRVLRCFSYVVAAAKERLNNKAIIFDDSIDRSSTKMYERVQEIAQMHHYPTFLVRLEVPKEVAFQRIMERENNSSENRAHYAKHFDSYYEDYRVFGTHQNRINHLLVNSGGLETLDIAPLIEKVKHKMNA